MIKLSDKIRYDKKDVSDSIEVKDVAHISVKENWIHRERFLFSDELICLGKGKLYLSVNGENYCLSEGSFFFIPRYSTISGYKNSDSLCSFYTVSYESNLGALSEVELVPLTVSGNHLYTDELLKRLHRNAGDRNKSSILLMSLIYEILDSAARENESKNDSVKPLMQKTIDYINANIGSAITVDSVCEYLNYSRDYISKLFLSSYGITIKKYIDNKKIAISKQLLLTSKMSLGQISAALGFDDAGQFYKFFKYHEKISPTEFREQNV